MSCVHNHLSDLRELILVQYTVVILQSMVLLGWAFLGDLSTLGVLNDEIYLLDNLRDSDEIFSCLSWSMCRFMSVVSILLDLLPCRYHAIIIKAREKGQAS